MGIIIYIYIYILKAHCFIWVMKANSTKCWVGRSKSSYFSAYYDSLLNGSDALNNLMQPIGSCIRTLQELFRENCIKGKLQNCIECQYHKSIIRWNITNCIHSKQHIIDVTIEIPYNNYEIHRWKIFHIILSIHLFSVLPNC